MVEGDAQHPVVEATIQAVDQNLKASRATSILSAPEFIAFCKNPEDYADESKVLTSSPSSTVSTSVWYLSVNVYGFISVLVLIND